MDCERRGLGIFPIIEEMKIENGIRDFKGKHPFGKVI
jgi:hypothetical protein